MHRPLTFLFALLTLVSNASSLPAQTGKAQLRAEYDCFVREGTAINLGRLESEPDVWVFATAAHIVQAEKKQNPEEIEGVRSGFDVLYPNRIAVNIRGEWVSARYAVHSDVLDVGILLVRSSRTDLRYAVPAEEYVGDATISSMIHTELKGRISSPGEFETTLSPIPAVAAGYSGSGVFAPGTDGLIGIVTHARFLESRNSSTPTGHFTYALAEDILSVLNKTSKAPLAWSPPRPDPEPTPQAQPPNELVQTLSRIEQRLEAQQTQLDALSRTHTHGPDPDLAAMFKSLNDRLESLEHAPEPYAPTVDLSALESRLRKLEERPSSSPSADCCDDLLDVPIQIVWRSRDGREVGRKQFTLRDPELELQAQRVVVQAPNGQYDADEYGPDEAIVISLVKQKPKPVEMPPFPDAPPSPVSP